MIPLFWAQQNQIYTVKTHYLVLITTFEILSYKHKNHKVKKVHVSTNHLHVNTCILIKLLSVETDNDADDIELQSL